MAQMVERMGFAVVGGLAALAASKAAHRGLQSAWASASGVRPPAGSARKEGWPLGAALGWTALSAAVIASAGMLGREGAARAWRDVFGHRPPND
jgi:hypothetical protein